MIKLNFILINLFIINIYCKHSDSTTIKTNQSLVTCSNVPSQKNSCDLLYQFSKILENNSAPSSSFSEEFKDNSIKENIRIIFPQSSLRKNLSSLNKNIKKKI